MLHDNSIFFIEFLPKEYAFGIKSKNWNGDDKLEESSIFPEDVIMKCQQDINVNPVIGWCPDLGVCAILRCNARSATAVCRYNPRGNNFIPLDNSTAFRQQLAAMLFCRRALLYRDLHNTC